MILLLLLLLALLLLLLELILLLQLPLFLLLLQLLSYYYYYCLFYYYYWNCYTTTTTTTTTTVYITTTTTAILLQQQLLLQLIIWLMAGDSPHVNPQQLVAVQSLPLQPGCLGMCREALTQPIPRTWSSTNRGWTADNVLRIPPAQCLLATLSQTKETTGTQPIPTQWGEKGKKSEKWRPKIFLEQTTRQHVRPSHRTGERSFWGHPSGTRHSL